MEGSFSVGGLMRVGMPNFLRVASELDVRQTDGHGVVSILDLWACGEIVGLFLFLLLGSSISWGVEWGGVALNETSLFGDSDEIDTYNFFH